MEDNVNINAIEISNFHNVEMLKVYVLFLIYFRLVYLQHNMGWPKAWLQLLLNTEDWLIQIL